MAVAGCGGSPDDTAGQLVEVDGLGVPSVESVDDAVFIADFAVVFEVTDERAKGSDSMLRDVTAEVRHVIWQGPRYTAPDSFTFEDLGWMPDDAGPRQELVGPAGIRVRPGHDYVGIFVLHDTFDDPPKIGPLAPNTVFELTGSAPNRRVELAGRDPLDGIPPAPTGDGSVPLSEFARVLAETRGHPELAEYDQEPDLVRRHVLADPDTDIRPGDVDPETLRP